MRKQLLMHIQSKHNSKHPANKILDFNTIVIDIVDTSKVVMTVQYSLKREDTPYLMFVNIWDLVLEN